MGNGGENICCMKLLMISSDTAVVQGVEGAFGNTLRSFHRFWDRLDIICPYVPKAKLHTPFDNVYFHPLSDGRWRAPMSVLRQGLQICTNQKPDLIVIHAYGMQLMSWGGWLLSRRLGIPFVVEVHHVEGFPKAAGLKDFVRKWATFLFLRTVRHEAAAFRVVNKAELSPLLTKLGVTADKIKIVYSVYLDTTIFRRMSEVPKAYDLIFVGRLVENKGLPLLIEAFEYLKRNWPQIKLLIIGRGPLEKWLKERLNSLSGVEHVRFLSLPKDVALGYNQAKIVICGSYAEGGPRYVVEAMACGLPAVSTPVGLMKEIVQDRKTGFVLRNWSAREMAETIGQLLSDEELYQQCSEGAQKIATQFEYKKTIKAYAETYRSLIQR